MFCKHDKRTKDIWQEFLTDKKNCEFFILYVYFITCKPFYCIIPKLWRLHDRAGCKTVFWSCLLRCAFLIVFNRIRIKAPLLTMTLPKNLEWQRFYARSVKWKIEFQFEHVIFEAKFFLIALGHPFCHVLSTKQMTKLPFNKGEPSKLPEPKIHLAIRNSLPIKNGTLIEAFSCFAGSNNDLSCYLACKILFNALLRLVNWQIHLPKPVYLSWVFCCLHAFITRQFEHVFRTNQMAPARNQSRQRGKSHAHGKLFFIETCEESYNGNVWSVKTAWMSFKRVLISNETKKPKEIRFPFNTSLLFSTTSATHRFTGYSTTFPFHPKL